MIFCFSSSKDILNKYRQSQYASPAQILTDACFIYRRQIIKKPPSNAMILRGREIAYQAANSPTIPSVMPNYTDDQVRELYGEIDKSSRRLKQNENLVHKPLIDAWNEKSSWTLPSSVNNKKSNRFPLPKFHSENQAEPKFIPNYLSTGLSNPRPIFNATKNSTHDQDSIRGSFRTSIANRTNISPSPASFDAHLNFNTVTSTSIGTDDQVTIVDNTQRNTSIDANHDSNENYEKINDTLESTTDLDQSSLSKILNEQTMSSINQVCFISYCI